FVLFQKRARRKKPAMAKARKHHVIVLAGHLTISTSWYATVQNARIATGSRRISPACDSAGVLETNVLFSLVFIASCGWMYSDIPIGWCLGQVEVFARKSKIVGKEYVISGGK